MKKVEFIINDDNTVVINTFNMTMAEFTKLINDTKATISTGDYKQHIYKDGERVL